MKKLSPIIFYRRPDSPFFFAAIRMPDWNRRIRRTTGLRDPACLPEWERLCLAHIRRTREAGNIFPFPKS